MVIPSQDLIRCKQCGMVGEPHKGHRLFCVPCGRAKCVAYTRRHREKLKANPVEVVCKGCNQTFTTASAGRKWRCQPCTTLYQREIAQKDKDRHAAYSRRYRADQGASYRAKMVQRRRDALAAMTSEERAAFRAKEALKSQRLNDQLREDVFAAYGGKTCACCGETQPLFLTIDHVNNDGAEMRERGVHSRGGTQFYQWLRKSSFPPGFQVLCMNCNLGKHRNGGVCPHQSGKV